MQQGVIEPSVVDRPSDTRYQFERVGYFWQDPKDSDPENGSLVFNQIVPLRDTWAEEEEAERRQELERKKREKEEQKQRQRQRSIENKRDPVELLSDEQRHRFERYRDDLHLDRADAAIIAGEDAVASFFEETMQVLARDVEAQVVANWVVNELMAALKDHPLADLSFDAPQFAALVKLRANDVISSRAARDVFEHMLERGGDPEEIVDAKNLRQIDDQSALEDVVLTVVDEHPDEAERYRNGKQGLIGFFMGQVMQKTDGKANPEVARDLLQDTLASDGSGS